MRYNEYLNFSLYQIKEFLALCEHLNYTKAAKECFVTQSTLSRNIQSMENTLGIQLFVRNTVKVTPTPAGRNLYEKLKTIFEQYEDAIMGAYKIQEGKSHPITIGINDGMDIMPELLPFIREFMQVHPDFEINVFRDFNYSLTQKMEAHECDIILDFEGIGKKHSFIEAIPLLRGPLMLYFLKTNPLSRKSCLTLEDLASQQLLVRSPSRGSDQVDFSRNLYAPLGIEPNISIYVDNASDLALNIQQDNQAILADGFFIGRNCPYLDSRSVAGTESVIYIKWIGTKDEISDTQLFIRDLLEYFSDMKLTENL